MQTWDFRIIDHGSHYGLHEVSYKRDGSIRDWSKRPVRIMTRADEGPDSIIALLTAALDDARRRQILQVEGDRVVGARAPALAGDADPGPDAQTEQRAA